MFSFSFKVIFAILNKPTQYISFFAISLFITLFILVKDGLIMYEDIFINSLKGLYPEFVTNSKSTTKKYEVLEGVSVSKEIFVYSQEIAFSYDGEVDISKFMNVRTYDIKKKKILFDSIDYDKSCKEDDRTLWVSNRLYDTMSQDSDFNKKSIYFVDNEDEYREYNICRFNLANDEKWMITSTSIAKDIAYFPFVSSVFYVDNKDIKDRLYNDKKVNNWKKYIDYDDYGIFLLSSEVSSSFLITFFIFLITFMIIAFSSLGKEFESAIFLFKLFGMDLINTMFTYLMFFIIYTMLLFVVVLFEYNVILAIINSTLSLQLEINFNIISIIALLLFAISLVLSVLIPKKYHRMPL